MNGRNGRSAGQATLTLLLILIIAVIANIFIFSGLTTDVTPRDTVNLRKTPVTGDIPEEEPQDIIPKGYSEILLSQEEIHLGDLILVNNDNAYVEDAVSAFITKYPLVNIYQNKTKNYALSNTSMELASKTVEKLNELFEGYYSAHGKRDIYLNAAHRTVAQQEEIFASKGDAIAAQPGFSEHHSGLAFDIAITTNGTYKSFTDEGHYVWIPENCADYGFIRRYPEGKTAITGISFEPWHFRYVGVPHSNYIYSNGIVLEEYIELLKNYTLTGEHLAIEAAGQNYEVYYVPSQGETTKVYCPDDKAYTVSGNNVDGFIVTVDMSQNVSE